MPECGTADFRELEPLFGERIEIKETYLISFRVTYCATVRPLQMSPFDNPVLYAYYATFMVSVTVQIFLPCFFGNELLLASEQLTRHAYASNWPLLGERFARLQRVFVERTQRSVHVMVVKMFPLKLQTFTSISSFGYRLYAVLKR